ncbi:MAG: TnsA-like heteromeric transposase endonuclease subunit, partial [Candidatus Dormibacteraceae bacterium]
ALLWPRETKGHRDHVPDFFVRLSSGDGRLVDVRSSERVEKNAEQFALSRRACDEVGWQYELFTGLDPEVSCNLRWLAGYRHDRSAPRDDTVEVIVGCFNTRIPLDEGIRRARAHLSLSTEVITANVLHLIWRQRLTIDLHRPLTKASDVWT